MKNQILILMALIAISGCSQNYVEQNGPLQILDHQLCNAKGEPIQLKGFSTYNITYCPECVSYDALLSNRDFWGANVVRATVYVDDEWNKRSYNLDPAYSKAWVDSIVNWSEQLGMYCIIDWHVLRQGNPNAKVHAGAAAFFREMSLKYADKPHVLYEVCNEPNGDAVTWDIIANYANRIIPVIRANAPASIIIVGTPHWSMSLDEVDPSLLVDSRNVMYAFHFYAASHAGFLPMFLKEIHRLPVFVTEWGACENTGNGKVDFNTAELYLQAMQQHVHGKDTVRISWCNFSYADVKETASALKPGSCKNKGWNNMTPTGYFIRESMMRP